MTNYLGEIALEIQELTARMGLASEALVDVEPIRPTGKSCLFIREDNLRALTRLAAAGVHVDFCYIDPPYNTGSAFVFNDSRRTTEASAWGSHRPWMEFMLPRLVLARRLLKKSGVIAVSIDDYAFAHLKILMDAVFGEDCSVGTLVVERSSNGLGSNKHIADMHEYVVLYGRTRNVKLQGVPESADRLYPKEDEHGAFAVDGLFRKKGEASLREDRPNMFYPLYVAESGEVFTERVREGLKEVFPRDSKGVDRRWLWGKAKATAEAWKLFASPKGVVYVKNYQTENKRVKIRSLLAKPEYLTDAATREVKAIFGDKLFDTPKPLGLISDLVAACAPSDAVVLDFFAGSGTTAEAIARLNEQSKTHRTVVLVEHEGSIPPKHPARKAGYKSTADLTEARLRKVADKHVGFTLDVVRPANLVNAQTIRKSGN